MTLAHASQVTGAPAKRIQNVFQLLGKAFEYPLEDVRRLGLALLLADYFAMDLRRAWEVAEFALQSPEEVVRYGSNEKGPLIEIDVPRYLSDFGLKCALVAKYPPRMAGRPSRRRSKISPRDFGIDIAALEANARRTPEERLVSLDENWKFVQALRA